jgi:GH25 family lysozyme M1 (1,4-beta-N-acetylmuramidase)
LPIRHRGDYCGSHWVIIAKIKVMLEAMEACSGKRPIIYTDPKFHREVLEGEFPNHHFWLRSVAARPDEKYRARNWVFWQFTTTGRVHGVAGPVDRNSFNGTGRRLEARAEKAMHLQDHSINVFERLILEPALKAGSIAFNAPESEMRSPLTTEREAVP